MQLDWDELYLSNKVSNIQNCGDLNKLENYCFFRGTHASPWPASEVAEIAQVLPLDRSCNSLNRLPLTEADIYKTEAYSFSMM